MTLFPIGLLIAFAAILAATSHLNTSIFTLYDFVAFCMVFGGTFAVAMIILPWQHRKEIFSGFKALVYQVKSSKQQTLKDSLDFLQTVSRGDSWVNIQSSKLYAHILNEGYELITLGISLDKIETILDERVFQWGRRHRRIANSLRSLAKYPPAFGLAGTVLGLMQLMKAISEGLDARQTGVEMAVALVATLYGLMLANLVINPAGESILKLAVEDEEDAEIAVKAVLLVAERVSILESQETLNSYVSETERIDILGASLSSEEAA